MPSHRSPRPSRKRYDIELTSGGNILPVMASYKRVPGMEGAIYYYYESRRQTRSMTGWSSSIWSATGSPPDFFTAGGMASALAIAQALETADEWDTETLIATMEGMSWETPKGTMTFPSGGPSALQSMYQFKIEVD